MRNEMNYLSDHWQLAPKCWPSFENENKTTAITTAEVSIAFKSWQIKVCKYIDDPTADSNKFEQTAEIRHMQKSFYTVSTKKRPLSMFENLQNIASFAHYNLKA